MKVRGKFQTINYISPAALVSVQISLIPHAAYSHSSRSPVCADELWMHFKWHDFLFNTSLEDLLRRKGIDDIFATSSGHSGSFQFPRLSWYAWLTCGMSFAIDQVSFWAVWITKVIIDVSLNAEVLTCLKIALTHIFSKSFHSIHWVCIGISPPFAA